MQEYGLLILIGVVLIAIFNFVALGFCFKTWRFMHVFATFLVFGATIAFCVFATISLKTNAAWKEKVKELREKLAEAEQTREQLRIGKDNTVAAAEQSHLVAPHRLWRETYEQGQILRACTHGAFNSTVSVTTFTPTEENQPVEKNGLTPATIVHVFQEIDWPRNPEKKLPKYYLGEFEVTAASDTTATLQPTLPLASYQQALLGGSDTTWTLYTQMPRDSHYAFVDDEAPHAVDVAKEAVRKAEQMLAEATRSENAGEKKRAESALSDAKSQLEKARASAHPLFGPPMSRDTVVSMVPQPADLKQLLPQILFDPDANYDELIQQKFDQYVNRYAYDGRPLKDIESDDPQFDPSDKTFQQVRFKFDQASKTQDIEVDAPAASTEPVNDAPFTTDGLALPDALRQGGPTKFTNVYDIEKRFADSNLGPNAVDDIGVFDQQTADDLIAAGRADALDDKFYVRELTDYESKFREYAVRDGQLDERRDAILAATKRATESTKQAQAQLDVRRDQFVKLDDDLSNFKRDLTTISAERQQLEASRSRQVAILQGLFNEINGQLARLNELQGALEAEAAKRAAMASSGGE